jgi:hypothetical protein
MDVIAGMEKQAIEKRFLRHVDNRAANVLQRLDADGLKALSLHDRMDWTRFLMLLRLRQPNVVLRLQRESAEHLRNSLAADPGIYESLRAEDDLPTLVE